MTRLSLAEVESLSRAALEACGASALQAAPVAHSIRMAEAEGNRGIGLGYLPLYCRHLEVGKVIGSAEPTSSRAAPGALLVDAAHGFAHAAYRHGEPALIEAARGQGIALLGLHRSYACGVLGYFVDRLARAGLVCIATTNASASMAPWGGREPFFGTNPWAFGAPRPSGDPLIVDSSSTATAKVNIVAAARDGREIPDHWALDAEGLPTTDAAAALQGSVAPSGGHKGAALALMVEILSAGLTGALWSHRASSLGNDEGGPPSIGQCFIAIRADVFGDPGARLETMLGAMTREQGVRIPGERRHANRRLAEREGVDVEESLLVGLRALAAGGGGAPDGAG